MANNNSIDPKVIRQRSWLRTNFKSVWPKFAISVALSLIGIGLQLLNPWPLKILVDSVFGSVPAPWILESLTGTYGLLVAVAALYIGLYLISGLLDIIDSYLDTRFNNELAIKLQSNLFRHILNLPLRTRRKIEGGDYVYRLNEQADNVPALIYGTYVTIVSSTLMILTALVILALLNWQMAAVGVLIVPLLYFSIRYFSPRIEKTAEEIADDTSEIYTESSESIEETTLIQLFNRQDFQTKRLTSLLQQRARKSLKLNLLSSKFEYANNLFTATGVAVVLLAGGYMVFNHVITLGELLIFITYIGYLYDPIESILSSIGDYKALLAGIKQVHEVVDEPADSTDPSVGEPIKTPIHGHIVFRGVGFSYGNKPILEHVNFEIQPGQKVAFVGPSGSGKSTILSFLPRINNVTSGTIFLDGKEISSLNLADLRNQLGVVSQEPELMSGTIHENVGFAIPEEKLDLPQILAAAEAANAYDFIKELTDGFDTEVGEGGSNLSGGQRQRISIARAFVKNPPVLLFDEPTSALDRESSRKIISAIKQLMVGKTVLMATHEISLLKEMDVVYIVDEGKVTKIPDASQLQSYIDSFTKAQDSPTDFKFS